VNSETIPTPVLDGQELERVEAAFLCGEVGQPGFHSEMLLLPVAGDGQAGVDYQPLMRSERTRRNACC
jgi:hypothetical protein